MNIEIISFGVCKNKQVSVLINTLLSRCKQQPLIIKHTVLPSSSVENEQKKLASYLDKQQDIHTILLDEQGEQASTMELSHHLKHFASQSTNICFIVGDAFGFSPEFKKRFSDKLSLSLMTFPHEVALYLLVEQLYRCKTLWENKPYHKP